MKAPESLASGAGQFGRQQLIPFQTTSRISLRARLLHLRARLGLSRNKLRVEPGLYALGKPDPNSPVFVTANYLLSFDALRAALSHRDAYILVLDTKGINVWCAAGKGTFGTDELIRQIASAGLERQVNHRRLIVPQLGAPGISAHKVKAATGFGIEYGPVRAADLDAYLRGGKATPAMRKVTFSLAERAVLLPTEIFQSLPVFAVVLTIGFLSKNLFWSLEACAAILAAQVLFPLLLPWLPTADFSTKGFILGAIVSLPFSFHKLSAHWSPGLSVLDGVGAIANIPVMMAVTSFLALNFTGSTTFASPSGVRREILRYARPMAVMAAAGAAVSLTVIIIKFLGGAL